MKRFSSQVLGGMLLLVLVAGCSSETAPNPAANGEHGGHAAAGNDPHAGHNMSAGRTMLMLKTDPAQVVPGEAVTLRLMVHDAKGDVVRAFEPIHEKLVHLIIVRDGLDQFAHLHPALDGDGRLSVEYTFPAAGVYHAFADHKPAGAKQALAVTKIEVAGTSSPAEPLDPNVPGVIIADQLHTNVAVADAKSGSEAKIVFTLHDEGDKPIADLEPYLGAMGHLVIISADATEYVHAHPTETSTKAAPDGRVAFEAHFAQPGIYKAWGQFQRGGQILTIPFVLRVE